MSEKEHWDAVYDRNPLERVSWYRPHLEQSMRFIEHAVLPMAAVILDVGVGTSTLVDDLLERGYAHLTVLDISSRAIARAQQHLGMRAARVIWLVADATLFELPEQRYDFWHDRAVFHVLRDADARRRYVAAARRALKPGGRVPVAAFGPSEPERGSGLEVMRHDAQQLQAQFGDGFQVVAGSSEVHVTPGGQRAGVRLRLPQEGGMRRAGPQGRVYDSRIPQD